MDIIQLLVQDHKRVKTLFRRFEREQNNRAKQRTAEEIIDALSRHAMVEEELVYPLLRARDQKHEDDVLEALEEHHVAKMTLLELDKMSVDDERYDAKMTVLSEAVQHHIDEEESELLPRLERVTSREERTRLAEATDNLKAVAPNHPHPMAPDTPPGNVIAGMLAKVLDMGKDAARMVMSPTKGRARAAANRIGRARRRTVRESKKAAGRGAKKVTRKTQASSGRTKTRSRAAG